MENKILIYIMLIVQIFICVAISKLYQLLGSSFPNRSIDEIGDNDEL